MSQLKDIGEFGFIERFAHKFDHLIKDAEQGIGDDCAVIAINENENYVITTDLLIEDVHFLKDQISPSELGDKSLAVNLSDIAAMGAQPVFSFLSIGIPKDTRVEFLDEFMEGYYQLSNKLSCPLMGGDTTKSMDRLVINVVAVGRCRKDEMKLRSMAESDDIIAVTGNLGDSAGGLKVLLDQLEMTKEHADLIRKHHQPKARISEGQWLAKHSGVHAMMDISDGIASDLKHILKASAKSAKINVNQLPISKLLTKVGTTNNWNITELASGGGEDYELLLTLKASEFDGINRAFEAQFGKPLYAIGRITDGEPIIKWAEKGLLLNNKNNGFDHFK